MYSSRIIKRQSSGNHSNMKLQFVSVCSFLAGSLSLSIPGLPSCDIPDGFKPTIDTKLPDPFKYADSLVRTVTKHDWQCRRAQLSALIQKYELGILPGEPQQASSSFAADTLTINAGQDGKSISFNVSVTYPTTGKGPFPAIIGIGGVSIPVPSGVAVLTLDNDDIAQQNDESSRGIGKFYDLYGSDASASAMMAWAWAVNRLVDALEVTQGINIDTNRLAVSGCSRNGKGALVAGAFEERIALTIPQESGSGGDACWRLSDAEQAAGYDVQTASEIVTENVWFSLSFDQFSNNTSLLPFDHHELAGLIAPRALLAIENTASVWLSPMSSYGCMKTAHMIWQAFGLPDNMGFTQDGNHPHCEFPAEQQPELTAYFNKFLLDIPADTNVFKTTNETFDEAKWIDWTVPYLL